MKFPHELVTVTGCKHSSAPPQSNHWLFAEKVSPCHSSKSGDLPLNVLCASNHLRTAANINIFSKEKKMTKLKKCVLSAVSIVVLMAVTVLSFASCDKKEKAPEGSVTVQITVEVTDDMGVVTPYSITTNKATLRGALEQEELVKGEEGQFGLYIKEVCGTVADYDTNGAYWALYKNGEYLTCSVDDEVLEDGAVYQIVYTK